MAKAEYKTHSKPKTFLLSTVFVKPLDNLFTAFMAFTLISPSPLRKPNPFHKIYKLNHHVIPKRSLKCCQADPKFEIFIKMKFSSDRKCLHKENLYFLDNIFLADM